MRLTIALRVAFILTIIAMAIFGCKTSTQNNTTKSVSAANDTVRIKQVIYIKDSTNTTTPVNTTIELINPCDSLGKLVKYFQSIKLGNDSITIDTRGNSINVKFNKAAVINSANTLLNNTDSNAKSTQNNLQTTSNSEVIVKTKYPWWLVVYSVVITLVAAVMSYGFFKLILIK